MTAVTRQYGPPVPQLTAEAHVGGDNNGQVVAGDRNVVIGSVHGNLVLPGERQPQVRRISTPDDRRPVPFNDLIGRGAEVRRAAEVLRRGDPVEFHGGSGMGKSVMLRHLAFFPSLAPPDGALYCRARRRDLTDVLQFLFDAFFECADNYSPRPGQVARWLSPIEALVLLDDVELELADVEELRQTLPRSRFLLTSTDRHLWGEGAAVPLSGLSEDGAIELVGFTLERDLAPDERDAVRRLSRAVAGSPRLLVQAVAPVKEHGRTLEEAVATVDTARPAEALAGELIGALPPEAVTALGVVAAFRGAPVHTELVGRITGLSDPGGLLEMLKRMGAIKSGSPIYSLTMPVTPEVRKRAVPEAWAERALTHFRSTLKRYRHEPWRFANNVDAIFQLIEASAEDGQWEEVVSLTRAADPVLITQRRWGLWERAVRLALQGAESLGDLDAEAWCRHQLGTRAVCTGDLELARTELMRALEIRRSLGQRQLAEVTQFHLDNLFGPPAPPEEPPPTPAGPRPRRRGKVAVAVTAVVVAVGVTLSTLVQSSPAEPSGQHQDEVFTLDITPVRVDFGERRVGSTGGTRTVKIQNRGPETFTPAGSPSRAMPTSP